ncbi:hypothetical protein TRVL_05583 [Trypanosoma vivax]|nr:hypothetical protein TRVL_05583 [Trypanosoma vivax]
MSRKLRGVALRTRELKRTSFSCHAPPVYRDYSRASCKEKMRASAPQFAPNSFSATPALPCHWVNVLSSHGRFAAVQISFGTLYRNGFGSGASFAQGPYRVIIEATPVNFAGIKSPQNVAKPALPLRSKEGNLKSWGNAGTKIG